MQLNLPFLFFYIQDCEAQQYDLVIRNGNIYDGSGKKSFVADIGINNEKIKRK